MWEHRPLCIILPPPFGKKKRGCVLYTWINWHLKEGAAGAVEEKSPQEKLSHKKMKPSVALGRRKGGTPVAYSGRTALRREQCDIDPLLGNGSVNKPTTNTQPTIE
jgi:hypothetical protein